MKTASRQAIATEGAAAEREADLAVVVVSHDPRWLDPCLSTLLPRLAGIDAEVIVVDNSPTLGTAARLAERFPTVRTLRVPNYGFAHANNQGIAVCRARYVLLLNPDTEILAGNFAELVEAMDARPLVGLAGVRQVTASGELWPTIRYFPSVGRAVGEALASERWPRRPRWAGERELDPAAYERESACDWTSGSFMVVRREALLGAGLLDERFFLFCEETDLCLRIKRGGWEVRHLPSMTIAHHTGGREASPRMVAQDAFARAQYAGKHFREPVRSAYVGAVLARHLMRALAPGGSAGGDGRRAAARRAVRTLCGDAEPPFGAPPRTAVAAPEAG